MGNTVVKNPDFPLRHAQITELKNTKKIAEEVEASDILIVRNGETVGYLVNPAHYEALIEAWKDAASKTTKAFLKAYEKRHGALDRLDSAYAASLQGEHASEEEVRAIFGD
ncbi:MAG TPA: hypothetical protein V6D00_15815 [Pantanalinema sp.]